MEAVRNFFPVMKTPRDSSCKERARGSELRVWFCAKISIATVLHTPRVWYATAQVMYFTYHTAAVVYRGMRKVHAWHVICYVSAVKKVNFVGLSSSE